MFQRLLICTDLGDGIERLVRFVPQLAEAGVQKLVFLHSAPLDDDSDIPKEDREAVQAAKQILAPALAQSLPGIEVAIEVDSGAAQRSINRAVQQHQADLVVLGSPIRSLLTKNLFGSTSAVLAQTLQCPLLILRPPVVSTYMECELALRCKNLFRSLLLPYDGSQSANHTIAQIKQKIANNPQSTLESCVLVWVIEIGGRLPKDYLQAEAETKLAAAQQELEAVGLKVSTHIARGGLMEQIMRAATREDISAIAISDRKTNRFLELSVPSFGAEVLRQSWHPVLFFPPS